MAGKYDDLIGGVSLPVDIKPIIDQAAAAMAEKEIAKLTEDATIKIDVDATGLKNAQSQLGAINKLEAQNTALIKNNTKAVNDNTKAVAKNQKKTNAKSKNKSNNVLDNSNNTTIQNFNQFRTKKQASESYIAKAKNNIQELNDIYNGIIDFSTIDFPIDTNDFIEGTIELQKKYEESATKLKRIAKNAPNSKKLFESIEESTNNLINYIKAYEVTLDEYAGEIPEEYAKQFELMDQEIQGLLISSKSTTKAVKFNELKQRFEASMDQYKQLRDLSTQIKNKRNKLSNLDNDDDIIDIETGNIKDSITLSQEIEDLTEKYTSARKNFVRHFTNFSKKIDSFDVSKAELSNKDNDIYNKMVDYVDKNRKFISTNANKEIDKMLDDSGTVDVATLPAFKFIQDGIAAAQNELNDANNGLQELANKFGGTVDEISTIEKAIGVANKKSSYNSIPDAIRNSIETFVFVKDLQDLIQDTTSVSKSEYGSPESIRDIVSAYAELSTGLSLLNELKLSPEENAEKIQVLTAYIKRSYDNFKYFATELDANYVDSFKKFGLDETALGLFFDGLPKEIDGISKTLHDLSISTFSQISAAFPDIEDLEKEIMSGILKPITQKDPLDVILDEINTIDQKYQEAYNSIDVVLMNSANFVKNVKRRLESIINANNGSPSQFGNDYEVAIRHNPELEMFKSRKTELSDKEWYGFLNTLPEATAYLKSIGKLLTEESNSHQENIQSIKQESQAHKNLTLTQKAQSMTWKDFALDESLSKEKIKQGLITLGDAEKFWTDVNYKKPIDYYQMSREQADSIIKNNVPYETLTGWYERVDFDAKTDLEKFVLANDQVRNAAMNKMYYIFQQYTKKEMDFYDFLNTEFDVFRGDEIFSIFNDMQSLSFSFLKEHAEKFNENVVTSTKVKPTDTIGTLSTKRFEDEAELFVPSSLLPYKSNQKLLFDTFYNSLNEDIKKVLDDQVISLEQDRIKKLIGDDVVSIIDKIKESANQYFSNAILEQFKSGKVPTSFNKIDNSAAIDINRFIDVYNTLPDIQKKMAALYASLPEVENLGDKKMADYTNIAKLIGGMSGITPVMLSDPEGYKKYIDSLTKESSFTFIEGEKQKEKLPQIKGWADGFKELINIISKANVSIDKFISSLGTLESYDNGRIHEVLKALGAENNQGKITAKQLVSGNSNKGGLISDKYVLIARDSKKYGQFSEEMSIKSQQAKSEGANVGAILGVYKDEAKGIVYELQNLVKGTPIFDVKKQIINTDVLNATDEQIRKLIADLKILQNNNIHIDWGGENVLYDKANGFSFVDLISQPTYFTAGQENTVEQNINKMLNKFKKYSSNSTGNIQSMLPQFNQRVNNILNGNQLTDSYNTIQKKTTANKKLAQSENEVTESIKQQTFDIAQNTAEKEKNATVTDSPKQKTESKPQPQQKTETTKSETKKNKTSTSTQQLEQAEKKDADVISQHAEVVKKTTDLTSKSSEELTQMKSNMIDNIRRLEGEILLLSNALNDEIFVKANTKQSAGTLLTNAVNAAIQSDESVERQAKIIAYKAYKNAQKVGVSDKKLESARTKLDKNNMGDVLNETKMRLFIKAFENTLNKKTQELNALRDERSQINSILEQRANGVTTSSPLPVSVVENKTTDKPKTETVSKPTTVEQKPITTKPTSKPNQSTQQIQEQQKAESELLETTNKVTQAESEHGKAVESTTTKMVQQKDTVSKTSNTQTPATNNVQSNVSQDLVHTGQKDIFVTSTNFDIEGTVSRARADISVLRAEVQGLEYDFSKLTAQANGIKTPDDLAKFNNQLKATEDHIVIIKSLNQQFENVKKSINALGNSSEIGYLNSEVKKLENTLNAISNKTGGDNGTSRNIDVFNKRANKIKDVVKLAQQNDITDSTKIIDGIKNAQNVINSLQKELTSISLKDVFGADSEEIKTATQHLENMCQAAERYKNAISGKEQVSAMNSWKQEKNNFDSLMNSMKNYASTMKILNQPLESLKNGINELGDIEGVDTLKEKLVGLKETVTNIAKENNVTVQQQMVSNFKKQTQEIENEIKNIKNIQALKKEQEKYYSSFNNSGNGGNGEPPTFDVKKYYSDILKTINEINRLNSELVKYRNLDKGTGTYSSVLNQIRQQKNEQLRNLEEMQQRINEFYKQNPFIQGSEKFDNLWSTVINKNNANGNAIPDFLNDTKTQATLTRQEIDKLVNSLKQIQLVDSVQHSNIIQTLAPIQEVQNATKLLDESRQTFVLGQQDMVESYKDIEKISTKYKNGNIQWDNADIERLQKLTNEYSRLGNERLKIAQIEESYFKGRQKFSETMNANDIQSLNGKNSSNKNTYQTFLESQAKAFIEANKQVKDEMGKIQVDLGDMFINGFKTSKDGISSLDFSAFDNATNTMRNFRLEMGKTSQEVFALETTINKSSMRRQAAEKQLQSSDDMLTRLGMAGVNTNSGQAPEQVQKLLGLMKELRAEINKGDNADAGMLNKLTRESKLASKEVEKLFTQMSQAEENLNKAFSPAEDMSKKLVQATNINDKTFQPLAEQFKQIQKLKNEINVDNITWDDVGKIKTIDQLTQAFVKSGNAALQAAEKQQQYLSNMEKIQKTSVQMATSQGIKTVDYITAADSLSNVFQQRKQAGNNAYKQQLEAEAKAFVQSSKKVYDELGKLKVDFGDMFVTGFNSKNGIHTLDFSVFDNASSSLRTFQMAMGDSVNGIYKLETTVDSSLKNIANAQNQVKSIQSTLETLKFSGIQTEGDQAPQQVQNLIAKMKELNAELSKGDNANQGKLATLTRQAKTASAEVEKAYKQMEKVQGILDNSQQNGAIGKQLNINNIRDSASQAIKEYAQQYGNATVLSQNFSNSNDKVTATLATESGEIVKCTGDISRLNGQIALTSQSTGKMQQSTAQSAKAFGQFKTAIASTGKQLLTAIVGYNMFFKIISEIREGINQVKEIDLAMTELKKVTDESAKSYDNLMKTAYTSSSKIGATMTDFINATANFARLGYNMTNASDMAQTAIVYKNVAEGVDSIDEASQSIISTMKAFNIASTDTMTIADKFNEVGKLIAQIM